MVYPLSTIYSTLRLSSTVWNTSLMTKPLLEMLQLIALRKLLKIKMEKEVCLQEFSRPSLMLFQIKSFEIHLIKKDVDHR